MRSSPAAMSEPSTRAERQIHPPSFPRLTLREADMRSEERRGRDGREGCGAEWLSHNV